MEVKEVLANYLKGRHTFGQMINLTRYFFGKKSEIVSWEPIYISVFPIFQCNLNCDMCLTHSKKNDNTFGQKPVKDIDFELFKQILNKYRNALAVNLVGNGEPLLHKDLFRMIDYAAKEMKMYVYSGSNGVILNDYIEKIVKAPLKQFDISVNGHNADEFHRMTGMPSYLFEKIRKSTVELVERKRACNAKFDIAASFILDRQNVEEVDKIIDFGDQLGVDKVLLFPFLASETPGFTAEERCLYNDDVHVKEILRNVNLKHRRADVLLPILLDRNSQNRYCSVPFYNISVDGEGNIGGCCCQVLDLIGNGKITEVDAFNNRHFKEFRRRFIDSDFPLLEPCTRCYNNTARSRIVSNPDLFGYLVKKVFQR